MSAHAQCGDVAKSALRDLGCKVELRELWTGTKGLGTHAGGDAVDEPPVDVAGIVEGAAGIHVIDADDDGDRNMQE